MSQIQSVMGLDTPYGHLLDQQVHTVYALDLSRCFGDEYGSDSLSAG